MDEHELIRENFVWGTYGKNGDEPLRFVLLKDITDDHLANLIPFVLERINHYGLTTYSKFVRERDYRLEHNITVPENPIVFKFGK